MIEQFFLSEASEPPIEGGSCFIGKYNSVTFLRASCASLLRETSQNLSAPVIQPATNIDFVGKSKPTRFQRAAFLWIDQTTNEDLSVVIETNPHFIGTYKATRINPLAFASLRNSYDCGGYPLQFSCMELGQYRIQNLSAAGYLLYIGVNCQPDFSMPAAAFQAGLPLTVSWPLPGSGIETLSVVPRFRDSYGCISQNSNPWTIVLSPTGQVFLPLPAPQVVFAYPNRDTSLSVTGQYPTITTETNPADMVKVWVDVVPPNTSLAPTYQGAISSSPFTVNFGSYTPGTYYVSIVFFRTLDGAMSIPASTTVVFPPIPAGPQAVFTDHVTPP